MLIKVRKVVKHYVDEINLTPDEWDSRSTGTVGWRQHMAALLNLRVKKLAPEYDYDDFQRGLLKFANEIGYGDFKAISSVTHQIYGMSVVQEDAACL